MTRPTSTATAMFLRELLRRWPTVLFMIFMPASYFLVSYLTTDPDVLVPIQLSGGETVRVDDRDFKALYLAVLGISVTSAFAALTTVLGSGPVMRRLRLVGYQAYQLLTARLAVLAMITLISTGVFLAIFLPLVDVASPLLAAVALLLVGGLGVGLGTLVGLLVPHEFEAAMIIVAFAGVQMALGRGGADAERYLLYWPAVEALKKAVFVPAAGVLPLLGQGTAYAAVLFALAYLIWSLRTRISAR